VIRRLDRFVPAIGHPGKYREARKDILEYKLLYGAMMQTSFAPEMGRWHVQGLYIITPSGKLLSGSNNVTDPAVTVREMDKGLERYASMPREERLLAAAPDPARDRVRSSTEELKPPVDGLVLRMASRGLPAEGLTSNDTRHPFFLKLDRVWYTQKEALGFVPPELRGGAKAAVKPAAVRRLARLYLGVHVQPNLYWENEDLKETTLTAEIIATTPESVEIRFSGRCRMESSSHKRKFEADLLGEATFRLKSQTFSAFDLLAIGSLTLGPWEKPEEGAPRSAPMGVLFTLNGKNSNDLMAPSRYDLYSSAE
jgi:hypothetical protein